MIKQIYHVVQKKVQDTLLDTKKNPSQTACVVLSSFQKKKTLPRKSVKKKKMVWVYLHKLNIYIYI